MGLFSFIGKAAKAVGSVIGGPVGAALKLGGNLVDHKSTAGVTGPKMQTIHQVGTAVSRGNPAYTPTFFPTRYGNSTQAMLPTPRQVLSSTPTMPGGGIATSSGVAPQNSGPPPLSFGGSGSRTATPRRRSPSRKRSTSSKRKKSSGRKLKFGSPAWRAKYLKKKRKR